MENNLPPGYEFRELMDRWDFHCVLQEQEDKLNKMFDDHELSLFFKKDSDFFGVPEDGRIVFAKLKSDDEDDPLTPDFKNQAKFLAINLIKSMMGGEDPAETLFGFNDLPSIKVCDREEVVDKIINHKPKKEKKTKKEKKK